MPRKNRNAGHKRRRPYRPEAVAELERIEAKRKRLKVTRIELAGRVGFDESVLRRMMKAGRAWPRQIRALTFALRTIERERRTESQVLE